MEAMVARYTRWAHDLVAEIVPDYRSALELGPTTFRPCPRAGPQGLHVDSFFFVPTQGRRVLRLFTNVNPSGEPRTWQVGRERFEPFARRLWPNVRRMFPGSGWALNRLGITKGRRTAYDHAMRQLRNLTKRDTDYQRNAPREVIEFPSSSTWLVFTDGLLHGALKGQFAFEQTFLSPVTTMREPVRSPLRVLEGLAGRVLAWGRLTKVRLINASCLSVYHQSCGYDRHGGTKTDPSQALGYGVRGVGALDSASQDASGRQTACANHPRLCRRAAGPRNRPASRRRRSRNGGGVSSAIVLREPAMRRARGVRAPSTTRRRPR